MVTALDATLSAWAEDGTSRAVVVDGAGNADCAPVVTW